MSDGDEDIHPLVEFRLTQVEGAVKTLADASVEFRNFMVEIRAWIKVLAIIWSVAAVVIAAVLVKLLVG